MVFIASKIFDHWYIADSDSIDIEPTHWMPLPEPPIANDPPANQPKGCNTEAASLDPNAPSL